jgi:Trp operon repressor
MEARSSAMIVIEFFLTPDQKERYSAPVQTVIVLNDLLPGDYAERMYCCQPGSEISTITK